MHHLFHIVRDVFAVLGVLWVVGTILIAFVEWARNRDVD